MPSQELLESSAWGILVLCSQGENHGPIGYEAHEKTKVNKQWIFKLGNKESMYVIPKVHLRVETPKLRTFCIFWQNIWLLYCIVHGIVEIENNIR